MKRFIPLIFLAVALLALVLWGREKLSEDRAKYSGTIEADEASLGSKVGGRVLSVHVKEGDSVKAGDLLVRLDSEILEAQVRKAEAELERARQRQLELEKGARAQEISKAEALLEKARQQYLLLKNGPRKEDIQVAKANLDAARAEVRLAAITEKRHQELMQTRNTTQENLDRARTEAIAAQKRLEAAEAELNRLLAGFRVEEVQAAKAQAEAASAELSLAREGTRAEQISQARAETMLAGAVLEEARVDLKESAIVAPSEGVIESCRLNPGDLIEPNQTALTIILHTPLWVRIFVPESHLGKFPLKQKAGISVQSHPGRQFDGVIVQANRKAEFTPRNVQTPETRDDLVFGIKIEIIDPDRILRPGMVADVRMSGQ